MRAEPTGSVVAGPLTRRTLLRGAATTTAAGTVWSRLAPGAVAGTPETRWLGPGFWPNRFQDWVLRNGRFECVAAGGHRLLRTIALLTRSTTGAPAEIRVRTGTLRSGPGFSGFLIGTGTPDSHPLSAALVLSAAGTGGGILCAYDRDGHVRFRDHTREQTPFTYPVLPAKASGPAPDRRLKEDVDLVLNITKGTKNRVRLRLRAIDRKTGRLLSEARLNGVARSRIAGGISLVSSDRKGSGARFWVGSVRTSGAGIAKHPDRALGPIVGTLFSRTGSTLRMTVQLMPDAKLRGAPITLQTRDAAGTWRAVASATVGAGFTAIIDVPDWSGGSNVRYRVRTPSGATWSGVVPAEPSGELVIASVNCVKATHRPTDRDTSGRGRLPNERPLGLYTGENIYFPYHQLVDSVRAHRPDLLVVHGDQFYETSPTRRGAPTELEFLYKYLMWLWSFREITRNTPTIVLVDDHDVFHPNLWGAGGQPAPDGDIRAGGYLHPPAFVNLIQRVQCGHNPPPYDPTPVEQGIGVYYSRFDYGGVSFALVEDRKFKSGPDSGAAEDDLRLLGPRQEEMLREWAKPDPVGEPQPPKIMLSQTTYACTHTDAAGAPKADQDSNGWPRKARDRALALVKKAGAVMLAGDQHLGTLVRHGFDSLDDGPIQFTAPAGSTSFQRWFEPTGELPRAGTMPYTGEWIDAFGNKVLSLAVVNPAVTQAEFRKVHPDKNDFGDRSLKNEGYGIVRVDTNTREFTFECWRWDSDPTAPGASQYPGWPYRLPFDDV